MNERSIFISYNAGAELDQTLAIRLYTIGQVNGFEMYLPDRYLGLGDEVDRETMYRIAAAKWFICFSTRKLSPGVVHEIDFALSSQYDRSRIIVIYDASRYQRSTKGSGRFMEYFFDPRIETADQAIVRLLSYIDEANRHAAELRGLRDRAAKATSQRNALAAFLGIGVGLVALNALIADEPKAPAVSKKGASRSKALTNVSSKKAPAARKATRKTASGSATSTSRNRARK